MRERVLPAGPRLDGQRAGPQPVGDPVHRVQHGVQVGGHVQRQQRDLGGEVLDEDQRPGSALLGHLPQPHAGSGELAEVGAEPAHPHGPGLVEAGQLVPAGREVLL